MICCIFAANKQPYTIHFKVRTGTYSASDYAQTYFPLFEFISIVFDVRSGSLCG